MELTKGAKDTREFFSDIEAHFKALDDKRFNEQSSNLHFQKGKKIFLELTIEDPEMTPWFIKWLYDRDKFGKPYLNMGARLDTIHLKNPANIADSLRELADKIDNGEIGLK